MESVPRVAALLTSFNRRDQTLATLDDVLSQESCARVDVYLTDDGSTDGTGDAVARAYPETVVLRGDGDLYWCRGMVVAWKEAMRRADYDYFWWLNDDTRVTQDCLERLLAASASRPAPVTVVGSVVDPTTGKLTYGGLRRPHALRPLHFELITPGMNAEPAQTMNGNCVLIPHATTREYGILDEHFEHAMGDLDFGLRVSRRSALVVAPGVVGECARNVDAPLPKSALGRWRFVTDRKRLPVRSWFRLSRRHAGTLWPVWFVLPYLRALTGMGRTDGDRLEIGTGRAT